MRCIAGFVLFVALYFPSCIILGGIVRTVSISNGNSPSVARAAEANAITKWHALVAVGAGATAFFFCSLPTLLAKRCKQDEWYDEVGKWSGKL
jgi:hypothetical protein